MDDAVNGRVGGKDLVYILFYSQVDLMKGRALAANQLDTIESDFGRVVEVVDDDNVIASFKKGQRCERADVAGATIPITMLADPLDESCSVRADKQTMLQLLCKGEREGKAKTFVAYPVTRIVPTGIVNGYSCNFVVGYRIRL